MYGHAVFSLPIHKQIRKCINMLTFTKINTYIYIYTCAYFAYIHTYIHCSFGTKYHAEEAPRASVSADLPGCRSLRPGILAEHCCEVGRHGPPPARRPAGSPHLGHPVLLTVARTWSTAQGSVSAKTHGWGTRLFPKDQQVSRHIAEEPIHTHEVFFQKDQQANLDIHDTNRCVASR